MGKQTIKAAIFDVDGTLLDSMYVWEHVGEQYLLAKGVTPQPDMEERVRTMSMKQIARYCQTEYGIQDSAQEIMDEINGIVAERYRTEVVAKKGAKELLEVLHQNGVKIAIATASDRCILEQALKRNGLLENCDLFLTCTEVGAGKDQPLIFQEACKRLQVLPSETVVFEDSLYAMQTASSAGCRICAISDSSAEGEKEQIQRQAEWYVNTPEEWMNGYFVEKMCS